MNADDTIVAVSTPPGESAIGIVRMSGDKATAILARMFSAAPSAAARPRHAHHGWIVSHASGERIDEVVVTTFPSPNSYTGEDVVEISAHGSAAALRAIVEIAIAQGARMAEPGEFTRRAFVNGKMSLDEAESVIDIIRAHSERSLKTAAQNLSGVMARTVESLREGLVSLIASIEASIDFPEDDINEVAPQEVMKDIQELWMRLDALLQTYEHGRILREGIQLAIVGPPNAGKSSLLNALLRYERALVSPIPGTTRDTVEEPLLIKGIPIKAIDTAGLRSTSDPVESLGVMRTHTIISQADIIILVLDASVPLSDEDRALLYSECLVGRRVILCLNKTDLPRRLEFLHEACEADEIVETSALMGEGLERLENAITAIVHTGLPSISEETVVVTRLRHKELLERASESLKHAMHNISGQVPLDCVAIDLHEACAYLGQITGHDVSEDVLDRIFSEFCIGK